VISVRIYRRGIETVVAACDAELLGRRLSEGKVRLHVNEFYDGERIDEASLANFLKSGTIINLVGERCVKVAVELGLVDSHGVMYIDGVPHAQVFFI
jgi:hypothetical protein